MKKIRLGLIALLSAASTVAAVGSAAGAADHEQPVTYVVEITNLTAGQYLTPANYAAHDRSVAVFERNRPASPGVQAVAENGGVPVLAAELAAAVDAAGLGVSGVAPGGPLGPGQSVSFEVTTTERRLSLVAMLICTNDGFAGLDARPLPTGQQSVTYRVGGFDAGTEINTEQRADLVPAPFCQVDPMSGTGESNPELAENGTVRPHQTIRGVGDLDTSFDWNGPVAEVTVRVA